MEVNPSRTPRSPARERRNITNLTKRAPGKALVPEVPPVEEALRRVQAPAPAPGPRKDVREVYAMLADLAAVRERVHNLICVRKLAAFHKPEQIRRFQMLEEQAIWTREGSFDRNEIIAERLERTLRRLYVGYDPEPFYIGVVYTITLDGRLSLKNSLWA